MIHHLIRAAILTGFAMFIVYLDRTGEMGMFIAPRMELYVKLSALGLYAAAIYQIYAALQKRIGHTAPSCDCEHEPSPSVMKSILIYGLFIFPLLLGFLVPTGTLGSALASKKGVNFSTAVKLEQTAPQSPHPDLKPDSKTDGSIDSLFPFDEYTEAHAAYGKQLYKKTLIPVPEHLFIETLTTLDLYRNAFIGKEVEISGFVYREDDMGKEQLVVSRFVMNCCSADAMPYGLMINWPKAMNFANDEWVSVKGILSTAAYQDHDIISLDVTKIERIHAPDSPYVYPDLDFGL
ncbi:putative repeat protein (TIGR03943 family) [Paenibacillus castaneae]|uniref:TIGR03943 family putative permease subunit n=1 Tax=Paenibacillus castaneae TaxID=474957 RepID=UPI000C9AA68C|nr:TIGR03943 family protein [Paenibacillus castaneae]NIK78425.1 putative repeat protein (TIGR03943 family) [Paenibacillus castaneae]